MKEITTIKVDEETLKKWNSLKYYGSAEHLAQYCGVTRRTITTATTKGVASQKLIDKINKFYEENEKYIFDNPPYKLKKLIK